MPTRVLATIGDPAAAQALEAERALVAALGGGCQLPLGAIAVHDGDDLDMQAIVTSVDGSRQRERHARGPRRACVAVWAGVWPTSSPAAGAASRFWRRYDDRHAYRAT